ncbi:methionine--tRNA ligase [Elusimicrobiota bacterium]
MENILVCVAWPYANNSLHLGHIVGSFLPADIFARYHRMTGNKVLMVSGSDEHGTPVTIAADKAGKSPKEIIDHYHNEQVDNINRLGIQFDLYTRTSSPNHVKVAQEMFLALNKNGYVIEREVQALYCPKCARFLPDRYVEGACHFCGANGARGDQCDACGKLTDALELKEPYCGICKAVPQIRNTKLHYFKLDKLSSSIEEYLKDKQFWKSNVLNFTKNWIKEGLRERPITRDLNWGVPVPMDGCDGKCIYVWFEAVMGYFSASKEWAQLRHKEDEWKEFWQNPKAKSFYFIGKDNIPFHTILWPASLIGVGGLNLPYNVPANEHLTFNGEKFSKSKGIGINVPDCLAEFDPDTIRYYLTAIMPESADTDFSWDDFVRRNNTELVGVFGNLAQRVMSFAKSKYGKVVKKELSGENLGLIKKADETAKKMSEHIEACEFRAALRELFALAHEGNQWWDKSAPWKVFKEDKGKAAEIVSAGLRLSKALSVLCAPYLPFTSQRLWEGLGGKGSVHEIGWFDGTKDFEKEIPLEKLPQLFSKIEREEK